MQIIANCYCPQMSSMIVWERLWRRKLPTYTNQRTKNYFRHPLY